MLHTVAEEWVLWWDQDCSAVAHATFLDFGNFCFFFDFRSKNLPCQQQELGWSRSGQPNSINGVCSQSVGTKKV